jgi:hypothetical protein
MGFPEQAAFCGGGGKLRSCSDIDVERQSLAFSLDPSMNKTLTTLKKEFSLALNAVSIFRPRNKYCPV